MSVCLVWHRNVQIERVRMLNILLMWRKVTYQIDFYALYVYTSCICAIYMTVNDLKCVNTRVAVWGYLLMRQSLVQHATHHGMPCVDILSSQPMAFSHHRDFNKCPMLDLSHFLAHLIKDLIHSIRDRIKEIRKRSKPPASFDWNKGRPVGWRVQGNHSKQHWTKTDASHDFRLVRMLNESECNTA